MSASSSSIEENLLLLQDDDYGAVPTNAFVVMVLTIVAFCVSFFLCACAICDHFNNASMLETGSIEASFCFVLATFCFLIYGYSANNKEKQEYLGKMRVIGYEVIPYYGHKSTWGENDAEREDDDDANKPKPFTSWSATLQLDWGYDWACLDSTVQCSSTYKLMPECWFEACNSHECTDEETDKAQQQVRDCIRHDYFNDTMAYTPYNPLVGPSHDVDWPNIILYGDCDTCEITESVVNTRAMRNLRLSGFVFLCLSILYLFIFITFRRKAWGKKTVIDKVSRRIVFFICCCNQEIMEGDENDDHEDETIIIDEENHNTDESSECSIVARVEVEEAPTTMGENVTTEQQNQQKDVLSEQAADNSFFEE